MCIQAYSKSKLYVLSIYVSRSFHLCRWMRQFGLKVPPEKSARKVMASWIDMNDVEVEFAPFLVQSSKGPVMKSKAMAYVTNLPEYVMKHLDLLDK